MCGSPVDLGMLIWGERAEPVGRRWGWQGCRACHCGRWVSAVRINNAMPRDVTAAVRFKLVTLPGITPLYWKTSSQLTGSIGHQSWQGGEGKEEQGCYKVSAALLSVDWDVQACWISAWAVEVHQLSTAKHLLPFVIRCGTTLSDPVTGNYFVSCHKESCHPATVQWQSLSQSVSQNTLSHPSLGEDDFSYN